MSYVCYTPIMDYLQVKIGSAYTNTTVDSDVYDWARKYKWSINKDGYVVRRSHGKEILLHRVVNNTPTGSHTDHINRDKLDNRRKNLRSCTHQQNQANARLREDNTTGYRGVVRHGDKWKANIFYHGKTNYIGVYDTPLDAALEFDHVALQLDPAYATNKRLGLLS